MQAAELLANTKTPTRAEIVAHMDGNICRCGTYPRIVRAIERAAKEA
jgi:isoquinoline 1-oxidoreductase alpha subunit